MRVGARAREVGQRLVMEYTPLEGWGLEELRGWDGRMENKVIWSPSGACEGEFVAVGETETKDGEDQEMA